MRQLVLPVLLALVVVCTARPLSAQNKSNDPQLARWLEMKRQLQAPEGKQYFESTLRDALVPGEADNVHVLRGTILSGKPAKRPSELVLAISDDHTPEVTLTLRDHRQNLVPLLKPITPGTEIEFYGIPVAFKQNPFMLTFEVQAENGPSGANPRLLTKSPPKAKP